MLHNLTHATKNQLLNAIYRRNMTTTRASKRLLDKQSKGFAASPDVITKKSPSKRVKAEVAMVDVGTELLDLPRCSWCKGSREMMDYHDKEWGNINLNRSDRVLFEFLTLEGAQAGLSWATILKKREGYREVFEDFDMDKVAQYNEDKIQDALVNPSIVRNQAKVRSVVGNAKVALDLCEEFGSLDAYFRSFLPSKEPIINHWESLNDMPAKTSFSEEISKDLKKREMKFVGPTIIYAFLQAVGYVNDHTVDCIKHPDYK